MTEWRVHLESGKKLTVEADRVHQKSNDYHFYDRGEKMGRRSGRRRQETVMLIPRGRVRYIKRAGGQEEPS